MLPRVAPEQFCASFIFDIDGTLADCGHRRHLVVLGEGRKHKDWDQFFALAPLDPVIEPVAEVLRALAREGTYAPLIVSARRSEEREATLDWLKKNSLWFEPYKLYMREPGDHRDDQIFKRDVLSQIRSEGWNPIGVFDDRRRVVDMWRSEGLICFHVDEGEF